MYISEIYASDFRYFDPIAPLQIKLSAGLNIQVGPNDARKSAIDAARYVLWTRGDDYIRPGERLAGRCRWRPALASSVRSSD